MARRAKTLKEKIIMEMMTPDSTKFRVIHRKGDLPFILFWIGKHKLPSVQHFTKLEDALQSKKNLEAFGLNPSLSIDYHHCQIWDKKSGQFLPI